MKLRRIGWKGAAGGAGVLLLLGVAYVLLASVGLVPAPFTCMTETRARVTNLADGDFEITHTDCDTLAKEEFVSVWVAKAKRGSWFAGLFPTRTLLFRYDPAMLDSPLPSIRAAGPHRIVISIPRVSSVMFQSRSWGDVSIDYEIEQVDYPAPGPSQQTPH